MLDDFIDGSASDDKPYRLFDPPNYRLGSPMEPDDLQYCLPLIDRNWLCDVRRLPAKPKFDDWDALV